MTLRTLWRARWWEHLAHQPEVPSDAGNDRRRDYMCSWQWTSWASQHKWLPAEHDSDTRQHCAVHCPAFVARVGMLSAALASY
jgi:hypothetical protein